MAELMQNLIFIGTGLQLTLGLLIGGLSIGLILGGLIAILRYKKIACAILVPYISLLRGTPLLLQLSFIYFATPNLIGVRFSILTAGIITFGVNSSAYVAEILRAGIESLPKGQFEACKSLNISTFYTWKDIILPQVIRIIFPALISEIIMLLKETALISTIGGMDIMRKSQSLAAEQFTYFLPLCLAGAYYYLLVLIVDYCGRKYQQGGSYANNN